MGDQRVDESAVGISGGGMDDEACGLVDDDQMCILKADVERQRLRRRHRILDIGEQHEEILARPHPLRGVARRRAVAHDAALLDQAFEPAARHVREMVRQHAVEAHPVFAGLGADLG